MPWQKSFCNVHAMSEYWYVNIIPRLHISGITQVYLRNSFENDKWNWKNFKKAYIACSLTSITYSNLPNFPQIATYYNQNYVATHNSLIPIVSHCLLHNTIMLNTIEKLTVQLFCVFTFWTITKMHATMQYHRKIADLLAVRFF